MEYETYADVIDSYNISNEKLQGISLTDYIKMNNIKIKEIQMDPIGDFEKILKGSKPMEKEGIESIQLASGNMDIRIEEVVKEFIKQKGRRPRSLEEIKEFYQMEMTGSGGASNRDNVSLASYEPGKYAPEEIENVNVSDSTSVAPQAIVPTLTPSKKLPNEPDETENAGVELTCKPSPN